MELQINHIITLENKMRFILLNETMYEHKHYFLAMEMNENKEVIPSNVAILEEKKEIDAVYVEKVKDAELIITLTKILKAQL